MFIAGSWVRIPAVKRIVLALLLGSASLLFSQARKPSSLPSSSSSKLLSVKATGSKRYTSSQIAAATGLQLGQTVSEDDFKIVSQHLGETGAFSNVAYTFQFSSEGMKLDLQVTDNDQFVPARFDNFVWLSDQELQEKLRASVPLFQGQLPVAGNLADQVSDALQTLAIEHQLKGRADYLRSGPADGPIEAFDFTSPARTSASAKSNSRAPGPPNCPPWKPPARSCQGKTTSAPFFGFRRKRTYCLFTSSGAI